MITAADLAPLRAKLAEAEKGLPTEPSFFAPSVWRRIGFASGIREALRLLESQCLTSEQIHDIDKLPMYSTGMSAEAEHGQFQTYREPRTR